MTHPLLPARFLFRFRRPCRYRDPLWTAKGANSTNSIGWFAWPNWKARHWADVRRGMERGGAGLHGPRAGQAAAAWCRGRAPRQRRLCKSGSTPATCTTSIEAGPILSPFRLSSHRAGRTSISPRPNAADQSRPRVPPPVREGLLKIQCPQRKTATCSTSSFRRGADGL